MQNIVSFIVEARSFTDVNNAACPAPCGPALGRRTVYERLRAGTPFFGWRCNMPYKDKNKQRVYWREYHRNWYRKHPKKSKENRRQWNINNPDKVIAAGQKYWFTNRKKCKARRSLNYAVQMHRVIRQPCEVCGDKKSAGHHDDYKQPLNVRWFCREHHGMYHTMLYDLRVSSTKR